MPRMAKWKEKYECIKNLAPRPVRFWFEDGSNELKTHTIYDLIEETINDIFPDPKKGCVEAKNLDDYVSL